MFQQTLPFLTSCLVLLGCSGGQSRTNTVHDSAMQSVLTNDGFVNSLDDGLAVRLQGSTVHIGDLSLQKLCGMNKLVELDASNTDVTSAGLEFLECHENLTRLHLDNCKQVTNDSIPTLIELKQLEEVSLEGTSVTAAGISQLKAARPSITISS